MQRATQTPDFQNTNMKISVNSHYTNIEIKSEFPTPLDTFVDVLVTSAALPGPGTPVTSVPPRTPHPHTAVLLTEVRPPSEYSDETEGLLDSFGKPKNFRFS